MLLTYLLAESPTPDKGAHISLIVVLILEEEPEGQGRERLFHQGAGSGETMELCWAQGVDSRDGIYTLILTVCWFSFMVGKNIYI